jgi:uncharacterized membrane protein YfcA
LISLLRLLGLALSGLIAVIALIMSIVSTFLYKKHGAVTKKTLVVSGLYMMLSWIAGSAFVILWKPAYASVALLLVVLGGFMTLLYTGGSYFNLMLVEKGPLGILESVRQSVKKLLRWHR